MNFSLPGRLLAGPSGIKELMDDLGHALAASGPSVHMLGGGNPAHIPAVEAVWQKRLRDLAADPAAVRRVLGIYDPPRGNSEFLAALAGLLREELGWPVGPENIAVTPGGQTAFFLLFNLLAGRRPDGSTGRILFPLMPEYIGYANQGLEPGLFAAGRPRISRTGPRTFKYHVDFDTLPLESDIAALCVSRPTNPSGNVIPDDELERLAALAAARDLPLIIDNAYGHPFPGIMFEAATPLWTDHTIHVLSLSKLGLPGTRTAFVVAPAPIAEALSSMVAVTGLANGNLGQAILGPLLADGRLSRLCREEITPYYRRKRDLALASAEEFFPADVPWAFHESGGALFLWLWVENSPKTSRQIYEDLKKRGVIVVPGEYFFFGAGIDDWPHRHECLRISFAMSDEDVRAGLRIIGEELASLAR
jgi:valine--pyruvate aminotransferase